MIKMRYSVDRVTENIATLISDSDGSTLNLPSKEYGLSQNDVLDIVFEGDTVVSVTSLPDVKEERLRRAKERLTRLTHKNRTEI